MNMGQIADVLNNPWLITVVGGVLVFFVADLIRRPGNDKKFTRKITQNLSGDHNYVSGEKQINNINHTYIFGTKTRTLEKAQDGNVEGVETRKFQRLVNILFIDDDKKYKVVPILKKSGWIHTRAIVDAYSLTQSEIIDAHICFVDIQGVGGKLGFTDEGLGLALALKNKYPTKKIVLYSAKPGNMFHPAFKVVDDRLPKDADPIQFENLIEQFCNQLSL